ncbi:MAG: hypothetical protein IPL79_13790 [Myxococcales bacterium]|nr:hypothetical protein [Myxococcales bacterium]
MKKTTVKPQEVTATKSKTSRSFSASRTVGKAATFVIGGAIGSTVLLSTLGSFILPILSTLPASWQEGGVYTVVASLFVVSGKIAISTLFSSPEENAKGTP